MSKSVESVFYEYIKSKNKLKQSSISNYISNFQKHFLYKFSGMAIDKLSQNLLNTFFKEESKKISNKSLFDIIILTNAFLSFAHDKHYLKAKLSVDLPTVIKKEIMIFSIEEQEKLKSYLYSNITLLNLCILLTLHTGLRIGELCALTWQDINLEACYISITKTILRVKNFDKGAKNKTKIVITSPKSFKSVRLVPVPDFLIDLLIKFKAEDEKYILTNSYKFMEPRALQLKYRKLLKAIGIEYKNFHVLRHTFATYSNSQGIDIKILSELLGHGSVQFTLQEYIHPDFFMKKEAINKVFNQKTTV